MEQILNMSSFTSIKTGGPPSLQIWWYYPPAKIISRPFYNPLKNDFAFLFDFAMLRSVSVGISARILSG